MVQKKLDAISGDLSALMQTEVQPGTAERVDRSRSRSRAALIKRYTLDAARSWIARDVVFPILITRLMLTLVAWLALQSFQNLPRTSGAWEIKANGRLEAMGPHLSPKAYPVVNIWSRWDSGWYLGIAKKGYSFTPGRQSNTAFFPAYPMLMRVVHFFSRSNTDASWMICGIIVSNLALVAAMTYLALLHRLDSDEETASRSVLYYLVFPTTLFLSAVYTEALFLAATVAAFYHARRNQWVWAGVFAGVATLTRSPGVLLLPALLVEYLAQRQFRWRKISFDLAALAIIPACLIGHMLYFRWRFGNAMATQAAQDAWSDEWGQLSWPWEPFVRLVEQPWFFNDGMNFIFCVVILALTVLAAARLRPSYGVYAAMCYVFVTSWGSLESVPRYLLMIFPAFLILGRLGRNRLFHRAYLCVGSGLAAFFIIRFALWRWIA